MKVGAVVLAAGRGRRMGGVAKGALEVAGRPMVEWCIGTARDLGWEAAVVYGDEIVREIGEAAGARTVEQLEATGTADAVLLGMGALSGEEEVVVVLYGDSPLLRGETAKRLAAAAGGADAVFCGFRGEAKGLGRIVLSGEKEVERIAEAKEEERGGEGRGEEGRDMEDCYWNAGHMAGRRDFLERELARIEASGKTGERYLTSLAGRGRSVLMECDAEEGLGANDALELALLEERAQRRLRREAMLGGAIMDAPETVRMSFDTCLEAGSRTEAYVVYGRGVKVCAGARVRSFSYAEGLEAKAGSVLGPFGRTRGRVVMGEGSRAGSFVEVKESRLGAGAKVPHLSYVGDAEVGEGANIGAGAVTCNWSGLGEKEKTRVGSGAFIGTNSALVAPVVVGSGAYVGAGSVITKDVEDDALAIGRAKQKNYLGSGWKGRKGGEGEEGKKGGEERKGGED